MNFQKSPSACVYDYRIWYRCRKTTLFAFRDRYDHQETYEHKFHVMGSYRNFFGAPWSRCRLSPKLSFWGRCVRSNMLVIMTFLKSRFACVSDQRILSKRRATTLFALEDRYNHYRPYKHTFHVMKSHRNFFEGPEVTIGTLWSSLFEVTGKGRVSIWVWFSQNRYWLTFVIIKSYLSVARPFCLFWEIDTVKYRETLTSVLTPPLCPLAFLSFKTRP